MHRWLVVISLLLLTVSCDQTSKRLAAELLDGFGPYSYLNGSLVFLYTENRGAFLGIGSELTGQTRFWLFTVGVGSLLAVFSFKVFRSKSWMELVGWSLIVGGGLGNFIDRLLYDGHVIDFLRVGVFGFRTGIFNVADTAIVLGLGALLIAALRAETETRESLA